jgi:hypothetical protein
MTPIDNMTIMDAYMKVNKRERLKAFYIHLMAYVVVNTILYITNIDTNPTVFWGCLFGWGAGIFAIFIFKILTLDKQLEVQSIEVEALARNTM